VYQYRYTIILVFIVWTIYAAGKIYQLRPLSNQEIYLPSDHYLSRCKFIIENQYQAGANNAINVTIFYGVKSIDNNKTGMWNTQEVGEAKMDPNFDISSIDS